MLTGFLSFQSVIYANSPQDVLETSIAEKQVIIEVFERKTCQHCKDERVFLESLLQTRSDIEVRFLDIEEEENQNLWKSIAELENLSLSTPITIVGETIIQGFGTAETTGVRIIDLIEKNKDKENQGFEAYLLAGGKGSIESVEGGTCDGEDLCEVTYEPYYIDVPFLGTVDAYEYSLPVLSMLLGFIDGFNPCAMWVLVTFLLVLVQAGDRKKMWTIAGLFIVAEAIMYYFILNVWMTTWNFVQLDEIITPIVGIIAIGGGIFFLYEWKTADGTCKVTNIKQRAKISKKIRNLVDAELTLLTGLGIIGLALSVNIIEFACSIGIPQAFTKILDINVLSFLEQQFYMFLYILFYMIDDVIVFGIALYSFEKIGLTSKYSKWSNLIGGILMIILGILLIFAPEILVF